MRTLIILPAMVAISSAGAQQIDAYRYWFDDDVTNAVTTTVSASSDLLLNANWPAEQLSSGFHRVSVQVRDTEGLWSVPTTRLFSRVGQEITGYRYWVNDNTTNMITGITGPSGVVDLDDPIDPGTLTREYNIVTVQFRDGEGEWTVPQSTWFVKGTGAVNTYEWWIDEDIAARTSGSIGPGALVELIADLPTGTTAGMHTFTVRFRGESGTWSVPITSTYDSFTTIAELPGITDLLLFPNPVTDQLGLRLNTDVARELNLQVFDLSGTLVLELNSWAVNGSAYRNWDVSDLASGSYVLRITEEARSWSTRFVKR